MGKLEKALRAAPSMSREQAIILWNSLTPMQKEQFNIMLEKLEKKQMKLSKVNLDDQEVVQTIVVEDIDQPSKPARPFYDHFGPYKAADDPA